MKKQILEGNFTEFDNHNHKTILVGTFIKFSPMSYPGRIYGMYDWCWEKHKWVVNEKFCEDYEIDIKNNYL